MHIIFYIFLFFIIAVVIFNKIICFRCKSPVCLVGKTALITGGTSGIGLEVALALASRGCRVLIADVVDTSKTVQEIIHQTHNSRIVGKKLDLASLQSVRDLAKDIVRTESRLDVLINNAGVGNLNISHTEDGLERTLQINYFGHFLLTHLLIDLLQKSAPSRIIFTSSSLAYCARENLDPKKEFATLNTALQSGTYGISKLSMAGASKMFANKLKGTGVTSNAYNPGGTRTKIFFKSFRGRLQDVLTICAGLFIWLYGKTPEESAQLPVYLAVADELEGVTGKYFIEGYQVADPVQFRKEEYCEELWKKSILYTKLKKEELKI